MERWSGTNTTYLITGGLFLDCSSRAIDVIYPSLPLAYLLIPLTYNKQRTTRSPKLSKSY